MINTKLVFKLKRIFGWLIIFNLFLASGFNSATAEQVKDDTKTKAANAVTEEIARLQNNDVLTRQT